jgi:hypothetical protein
MKFALVLFAAALFLESVASYFSVVGLIATFTFSIPIILLALSLDIAKLSAITFMYREWNRLALAWKMYLVPASVILVMITTIGSYGFLIEHFQSSIADNKETTVIISSMEEEKIKLEARKKEIDSQIASLPENFVKGRRQLISSFKEETDHINSRLIQIDSELPEMKKRQVTQEVHVGPIAVLANVLGTDLEHAVQLVVLLIVAVMDPLAIALVIMGNKQLEFAKVDESEKELEEDVHLPEWVEQKHDEPEPKIVEQEQLREVVEEVSPLPAETEAPQSEETPEPMLEVAETPAPTEAPVPEETGKKVSVSNLTPLHAQPFSSIHELAAYAKEVNRWIRDADGTLIDKEHPSKPSEDTVRAYTELPPT